MRARARPHRRQAPLGSLPHRCLDPLLAPSPMPAAPQDPGRPLSRVSRLARHRGATLALARAAVPESR
jgi:hypothetical protein